MRTILFDIHGTVLDDNHEAVEHAGELLAILKRLGIGIGAFTHGDHRSIVHLEIAGIRHHFASVVTRERVSGLFSHSASLRQALRDLGAESRQAIVVSTNHFVLGEAKKLNAFKTIAITAPGQTLPHADTHVSFLPALLDVIE